MVDTTDSQVLLPKFDTKLEVADQKTEPKLSSFVVESNTDPERKKHTHTHTQKEGELLSEWSSIIS